MDPKELDAHYSSLRVEANEYFLNNVRSNQFSLHQNLMKLDQPVNKTMQESFAWHSYLSNES